MKRFIMGFALLFCICHLQPAFAQERYAGFDYFLSPIPAAADTGAVKGVAAAGDSIVINSGFGVWCFKPVVTLSLTAFDKAGNPYPFSGAGAGISFQREVNIKGLNKVSFEVDLSWLAFSVGEIVGNGPALLVGAYGATVGPAYDVKNKAWYALTNYTLTLTK